MDFSNMFGGLLSPNAFNGWGNKQQPQQQAQQPGMPMQLAGATPSAEEESNNKIWANLGSGKNADGTPNMNQGYGNRPEENNFNTMAYARQLASLGNSGGGVQFGPSYQVQHMQVPWHFGDANSGLNLAALRSPVGLLGRQQ